MEGTGNGGAFPGGGQGRKVATLDAGVAGSPSRGGGPLRWGGTATLPPHAPGQLGTNPPMGRGRGKPRRRSSPGVLTGQGDCNSRHPGGNAPMNPRAQRTPAGQPVGGGAGGHLPAVAPPVLPSPLVSGVLPVRRGRGRARPVWTESVNNGDDLPSGGLQQLM